MAERSQTDGGLRARDGHRRSAEPNAYARDEGGRLLAEYHARVRQPSGPDAFECAWFLTEAAALQGLFLPDSAMLFIPRALQRCPNSPRLHLAYAFVSEQQWMRGGVTPEQELEIVRRYEEAMKFPETEPEARVRAARFLLALGNVDRALEVITAATRAAEEREVRYLTNLVRGQVLRSAAVPTKPWPPFVPRSSRGRGPSPRASH